MCLEEKLVAEWEFRKTAGGKQKTDTELAGRNWSKSKKNGNGEARIEARQGKTKRSPGKQPAPEPVPDRRLGSESVREENSPWGLSGGLSGQWGRGTRAERRGGGTARKKGLLCHLEGRAREKKASGATSVHRDRAVCCAICLEFFFFFFLISLFDFR